MKAHGSLITLIDDFYPDPEAVRQLALEQVFEQPPSQRDPAARGPIASRAVCSEVMIVRTLNKLTPYCHAAIEHASIEFRYTTAATIKRQVCHADGVALAGIVHLTPPGLCQGGTDFFRHRPTGDLARQPTRYDVYDYHNPDDWEWVYRADMAFNRLVLYPGELFHAPATPFFGDSIENGRLTQNLFLRLTAVTGDTGFQQADTRQAHIN